MKYLDKARDIERQNVSVEVRMLRTSWMFRCREGGEVKSFSLFLETLAENDSSDIMHQTEMVVTIVNEFWSKYKYTIGILCFVPFMFYFHAAIYFFTMVMIADLGLA